MAENITSAEVLTALQLVDNSQVKDEFSASGIVPNAISTTEIKKTCTLLGVTPDDFVTRYTSNEFDFENLKLIFAKYCKDFNTNLQDGIPSKALEFSAKMLFEYGPFIRTEKKSKGDKAIRFRFPYNKTNKENTGGDLVIKVVIVITFKDMTFTDNEIDNKLVLTFRQAGLLAMVTFSKAVKYCYEKSQAKLLSPLSGAIYSRDSIDAMARELNIAEVLCLQIINESSTSGGQYLENSDIACAIACVISSTKKVTDKVVRDSMISRVVKQYCHKQKTYDEAKFKIYAKYALGGVPPGLDSRTLIDKFTTIQDAAVPLRKQLATVNQSVMAPNVMPFEQELMNSIKQIKAELREVRQDMEIEENTDESTYVSPASVSPSRRDDTGRPRDGK